jgi:phage-related protein
MADYGFTEREAREFLNKELRRHAASTSFYWEPEEAEEVLDLVTEVVAKLIAANNAKVPRDWSENGLRDLRMPPI